MVESSGAYNLTYPCNLASLWVYGSNEKWHNPNPYYFVSVFFKSIVVSSFYFLNMFITAVTLTGLPIP